MGWTQVGESGSTFTPVSFETSSFNIQQQFLDDVTLNFGTDYDFGVTYNSSKNQLIVSSLSTGSIAVVDPDGINALVFAEQSSLPGTATEGMMVYVNNNFYVGLGT